MKFQSAALAVAAFAAITFLAGCNRGASNTRSANSSTTSDASSTSSPSAKTTPTTATTITTSGGAETPTDAFKMYYNAMKSKDAEAIKGLYSRATLKVLENNARASNKNLDDLFKENLEINEAVPETLPETRNEKVEGVRATLEVKDEEKGLWGTMRFVKEDGGWKLTFAEDEPTGAENK